MIWLPRVSASAEAVAWRYRPLERPDGIPTLERGNEKRRQVKGCSTAVDCCRPQSADSGDALGTMVDRRRQIRAAESAQGVDG